MLSGANGAYPWAETADQGAGTGSWGLLFHVAFRVGEGPDVLREGREVVAVPDAPNVWTDGSLVQDQVSGASSTGSGFCAHLPSVYWNHRRWGHMDKIRSGVGEVQPCRGFCSVPGPLQSVQRAELWGEGGGVVLALQATAPLHLGADNLNVVRQVSRLLDGVRHPCPSELVKDGDLILMIDRIL